MPDNLPDPYDGLPVVAVAVKLTGGKGFAEAMATDGIRLHMNQRVTLAADCVVTGVQMKPAPEKDYAAGGLIASYTLTATERATMTDDDGLSSAIDAQMRRNDDVNGRPQLPLDTYGISDGLASALGKGVTISPALADKLAERQVDRGHTFDVETDEILPGNDTGPDDAELTDADWEQT